MAIGNGELMHECFPKHPRMGTARYKLDNETEEECKEENKCGKKYRGHERKKSCPVTLFIVTSVTHDSPSRSPSLRGCVYKMICINSSITSFIEAK